MVPGFWCDEGLFGGIPRWLPGGPRDAGAGADHFLAQGSRFRLRDDHSCRKALGSLVQRDLLLHRPATQDHLQSVFEYAAGLFDEIMIATSGLPRSTRAIF